MIGFYPASALLGRLDQAGSLSLSASVEVPVVLISVIPCILFMFFGIWLYHYMVKLYEGVGG
jgi:ABC-2 type transport system permease protein